MDAPPSGILGTNLKAVRRGPEEEALNRCDQACPGRQDAHRPLIIRLASRASLSGVPKILPHGAEREPNRAIWAWITESSSLRDDDVCNVLKPRWESVRLRVRVWEIPR